MSITKHYPENRQEFGLNELLFDVLYWDTATTPAAEAGVTLRYITRGKWAVESEFNRDSREALFDFNKLILADTETKLFIGSITSNDFLGFTVYWHRNRQGRGWHVSWRTRKARLRRAMMTAYELCRRQRHLPVPVQHEALRRRIQGHFNYFGVNDNQRSLATLRHHVRRSWYKWLNRRSQRSRLNWERFKDLMRDFPLPSPQVYVDLWDDP